MRCRSSASGGCSQSDRAVHSAISGGEVPCRIGQRSGRDDALQPYAPSRRVRHSGRSSISLDGWEERAYQCGGMESGLDSEPSEDPVHPVLLSTVSVATASAQDSPHAKEGLQDGGGSVEVHREGGSDGDPNGTEEALAPSAPQTVHGNRGSARGAVCEPAVSLSRSGGGRQDGPSHCVGVRRPQAIPSHAPSPAAMSRNNVILIATSHYRRWFVLGLSPTPEHFTSKSCCKCLAQCGPWKEVETKMGHSIRGLRICQDETCKLPQNRDRTGALNISVQFKRLFEDKPPIRVMTDEEREFHRLNLACVACDSE